MRKPKFTLSPEQFEALREKLNQRHSRGCYLEKNVTAAYTVMVQHESVLEVAQAWGMSRANLNRIVRNLWAVATASQDRCPHRTEWLKLVEPRPRNAGQLAIYRRPA